MKSHLLVIIFFFVTGCTVTNQNNMSALHSSDTLKFPSYGIVSEIHSGVKWIIPEGSYKRRAEVEVWARQPGSSDYSLADNKVKVIAHDIEIDNNKYRQEIDVGNDGKIRMLSDLQGKNIAIQLFREGKKYEFKLIDQGENIEILLFHQGEEFEIKLIDEGEFFVIQMIHQGEIFEVKRLSGNEKKLASVLAQSLDFMRSAVEDSIKQNFSNLGKTFKSGDKISIWDMLLKDLVTGINTLDNNIELNYDGSLSIIKGYGIYNDRKVIVADMNAELKFSFRNEVINWILGGYHLIDPDTFLILKSEGIAYLSSYNAAKLSDSDDKKIVFKYELFDINVRNIIM